MDEILVKMLVFFGVSSFGGWLLFFLGFSSRKEINRRKKEERSGAAGKIADYIRRERPSGRGQAYAAWYPVIEFAVGETPYRLENKNAMDPESHPVGEAVQVYYDEHQPENFHLDCDPAFSRGSGNAIRAGCVWIALSAALTLALAVFVGGLDLSSLWHGAGRPVSSPSGGASQPQASGGYKYTLQPDGSALITSYSDSAEKVTVPVLLDGHLVRGLSSSAFSGARGMVSLTIPGSFSAIPAGCFSGCLGLQEVTVRDGVKSIGMLAFSFCPSLKKVTLPASVTRIEDNAFPEDCSAVFLVSEGSAAQKFCEGHGYQFSLDDPAAETV